MSPARRVALLAPLLLALAPQGPPLTERERALVESWLGCIDCRIELDSLRVLHGRKPAAVVDTLGRVLREGPSTQQLHRTDSLLQRGFLRDSLWRAGRGLPVLRRDSVVASRLRRYAEGQRARGATGLGWIHTPAALAALGDALQLPLPPSVRRAAIYARDSLPAGSQTP